MFRISPIDPNEAPGEVRELLKEAERQFGSVTNLLHALARSPAALRGFLTLRGSLIQGRLPSRLRRQLALLTSEENGSRYCVSANSERCEASGLTTAEIAAAQRGESSDPRTAAALHFAAAVLHGRGRVTDKELQRVRAAGFDDEEITEIIAHVALNCFANFFCQVAKPDLDFPERLLSVDEEAMG
jgi:uncharacterized peroxidase-related enzyme